MEKIKSRWGYGIFVGGNRKSSEFLIANEEGIRKSRSIRRIAKEKKWSEDYLKWVKPDSWKGYEGDEAEDG
eukprot:2813536-Karenia_brevis.AAC.1